MKKTMIAAALALGMVAPAAFAQVAGPGENHTGGKAAMCIGCHEISGYKVAYPHVYRVPMIVGQNPKYIEAALKAYQTGERKHPTMKAVAASLSEKDISELAAYYGGAGEAAK